MFGSTRIVWRKMWIQSDRRILLGTIFILAYGFCTQVQAHWLDYKFDVQSQAIGLYLKDASGQPLGSFNALKRHLGTKNQNLLFAMNAGIFMQNQMPLGLYVERGVTLRKLNRHKNLYGNFYMSPNGVFVLTDDGAEIVATEDYDYFSRVNKVHFATQSGPMLVINNKINPILIEATKSKTIRNGVCVDIKRNLIFSISTIPVSFAEMATHFKTTLQCQNALYLDGTISKVYWPEQGYHMQGAQFGPMIGVTKK